jgi:hypothetical protein
MRRLRVLFALSPSLLAVVALAAVPWVTSHRTELGGTAIWGLVLLTSFVGWGGAVAAFLVPDRRLDWGLRSALGMAAVLAIGGALQVAFLLSPAVVMVMTLAGLAALAVGRLRRGSDPVAEGSSWLTRVRAQPILTVAICLLYGLILFAYLGSFTTPVSNPWDDFEAYFVFPKSLLAYGALHEPFSFRRVGALGGQSYLQSLLLTASTVWRLNGLDNGICLLSIFGMVHGYARRSRGAVLVALAFLVGFSYHLHNVASALSGTVFFFALFRILDAHSEGLTDRGVNILLGLVGAAAWTLRQNYLVPLLAILGAAYGLRLIDRPETRREMVGAGARTLGFLALFLIPWWIVSYRSSGTFMFPITLGNSRGDFGLLADVTRAEEMQFFVFNAFWNRPVRTISIFVLAALCLDDARRNRSVHAFLLGTGVGVVALIHGCRAWDDVTSVSRYYMAFEMALVLAALLKALTRLDGQIDGATHPVKARSFIAAALALLAVVIHLWDTKDDLAAQYHGWVDQIAIQLGAPTEKAVDARDDLYHRVQTAIPAGAPFMEILDEPFRFDFRRNRIWLCDQPGGASPRPGFPVFKGVEQYEKYLRDRSIRYLAYTLGPASPEYSFPQWQAQARNHTPPRRNGHTRGTMLRQVAVIYLDFFSTLVELSKRHKQLFNEGQIHVLDLDVNPDGAPLAR